VGVLLNRRRCLPSVCAAPNFESQARRPKKGGPAPSGDKTRRPSSSSKPGSNNAQQKRGLAPAPVSDGTPARLAKVMAAAGVASRRACEDLIASGEVTVNGQPVTEQGTLVRPGTDQISVKGKPLATSHIGEKYYYFAVNKPKGYICSNSPLIDKQGKRAIDLLEPWLEGWRKENAKKDLLPPRLFTVGRLDVASTGLIFITNDGHWAQKVIHPSSNLTKEYLVLVDRPATKAQVKTMMGGVEIDGVRVMPEEISTLEDTLRLRIVVGEGKKHEVRILVASVGLEVLSLKRVRVGGYRIPRSLNFGDYIPLSPTAIKKVTSLKEQEAQAVQQPQKSKFTVKQPQLPPSLL